MKISVSVWVARLIDAVWQGWNTRQHHGVERRLPVALPQQPGGICGWVGASVTTWRPGITAWSSTSRAPSPRWYRQPPKVTSWTMAAPSG